MLPSDLQIDPLVEILRLAYRRGLVIRQEQATEAEEALDLDRDEKPTDGKGLQPQTAISGENGRAS